MRRNAHLQMQRRFRMVKRRLFILQILLILLLAGCGSTEGLNPDNDSMHTEKTEKEQWEKGYNLPVGEKEEKEAENDCKICSRKPHCDLSLAKPCWSLRPEEK